jgi:hypothetical protein
MYTPKKVLYDGFDVHFIHIQISDSRDNYTIDIRLHQDRKYLLCKKK